MRLSVACTYGRLHIVLIVSVVRVVFQTAEDSASVSSLSSFDDWLNSQ
jgi:hypothetical protein